MSKVWINHFEKGTFPKWEDLKRKSISMVCNYLLEEFLALYIAIMDASTMDELVQLTCMACFAHYYFLYLFHNFEDQQKGGIGQWDILNFIQLPLFEEIFNGKGKMMKVYMLSLHDNIDVKNELKCLDADRFNMNDYLSVFHRIDQKWNDMLKEEVKLYKNLSLARAENLLKDNLEYCFSKFKTDLIAALNKYAYHLWQNDNCDPLFSRLLNCEDIVLMDKFSHAYLTVPEITMFVLPQNVRSNVSEEDENVQYVEAEIWTYEVNEVKVDCSGNDIYPVDKSNEDIEETVLDIPEELTRNWSNYTNIHAGDEGDVDIGDISFSDEVDGSTIAERSAPSLVMTNEGVAMLGDIDILETQQFFRFDRAYHIDLNRIDGKFWYG